MDVLRLDHFRGSAAYWRVPGDADDATGGRWVTAPGAALFEAVRSPIWSFSFGEENNGRRCAIRVHGQGNTHGTRMFGQVTDIEEVMTVFLSAQVD